MSLHYLRNASTHEDITVENQNIANEIEWEESKMKRAKKKYTTNVGHWLYFHLRCKLIVDNLFTYRCLSKVRHSHSQQYNWRCTQYWKVSNINGQSNGLIGSPERLMRGYKYFGLLFSWCVCYPPVVGASCIFKLWLLFVLIRQFKC